MPVSVVIPAYNAAATLAATLESLLAQTYAGWEAVVVDDGSTDATGAVVQRFVERDPRIRLISQPNAGEAAARNAALDQARFEWILCLDADDWIAPTHLEKMCAALESDSTLDAVHCGYARVSADGTAFVEVYEPPVGDLFPTLARRAAFPVHTCVVRKTLVDEVGRFDPALKTSPDWDLWQRIARTGARFGAVREVLAFYRMSPSGASLDARQLLTDGLHVLRQGHAPDPRVRRPHPSHAQGAPAGGVESQEFYLVSWCAGLMIGGDRDPQSLFDLLGADRYPGLYPEAIAQCLFDAIPLPTASGRSAWPHLWPGNRPLIEQYLKALEHHSGTPDLARRALLRLQWLILSVMPEWASVMEMAEEDRRSWQQTVENWQQRADSWQRMVDEYEGRIERLQAQVDGLHETQAAMAAREVRLAAEWEARRARLEAERSTLEHSHERQLGDLLLNRWKLKPIALGAAGVIARARQRATVAKMAADSRTSKQPRVVATACDVFPIYSQTFVYQELVQLERSGFDLRFVYSKLDSQDRLQSQFAHLWDVKRPLVLNHALQTSDLNHYRTRMAGVVDRLLGRLSDASGISPADLLQHDNVRQAFTYTRMVEAYRPVYLHSYFFYDRSLMSLVAAYLLNLPRGISCYADHMLKDYELKVVPLHLELCDIVVATSARIKQELLGLAPDIDPEKVLVKPNGIDADRFPVVDRRGLEGRGPYRLVTVCRIEPKKGLIDLVEAVALLRDRGVDVEAHVLGTVDEWSEASRDYKARLDQRIEDLNVSRAVHLEGRQDLEGILGFLGRSHLFVAPFVETDAGDKDGIPTAVLEGMATGLPVVATDAGSIPEVVGQGRDGLLVPQREPEALAEAIAKLLRDASVRQRMAQAAADTVRTRYHVATCERPLHERIRTVVNNRRSR